MLERWREQRRLALLGPCTHALVVDEPDRIDPETGVESRLWRCCLLCGEGYDRGALLDRLRAVMLERHRLPRSPWTAEERAGDAW